MNTHAIITVAATGHECIITIDGELDVIGSFISVVEAIEYCEVRNWTYNIQLQKITRRW